eukprot:2307412-Alexandrium_andersonii.AAC.1
MCIRDSPWPERLRETLRCEGPLGVGASRQRPGKFRGRPTGCGPAATSAVIIAACCHAATALS